MSREIQQGFFESKVPSGTAACSDRQCPCPETVISRGAGYLLITETLIENRRDARTVEEAQHKANAITARVSGRSAIGYFGPGIMNPILMCRQGAELRGLDLEVAAADAKHWWATGLYPCG